MFHQKNVTFFVKLFTSWVQNQFFCIYSYQSVLSLQISTICDQIEFLNINAQIRQLASSVSCMSSALQHTPLIRLFSSQSEALKFSSFCCQLFSPKLGTSLSSPSVSPKLRKQPFPLDRLLHQMLVSPFGSRTPMFFLGRAFTRQHFCSLRFPQ